MRCGQLHRGMGTHISKPKGCTGTYLWGPDEVKQMQEMGNDRANAIYGGLEARPASGSPDKVWQEYVRHKYAEKKFVGSALPIEKTDTKVSARSFVRISKSSKGRQRQVKTKAIQKGDGGTLQVPEGILLDFNFSASTQKSTNDAASSLNVATSSPWSSNNFFAEFGVL